jgi:hypothetical protein
MTQTLRFCLHRLPQPFSSTTGCQVDGNWGAGILTGSGEGCLVQALPHQGLPSAHIPKEEPDATRQGNRGIRRPANGRVLGKLDRELSGHPKCLPAAHHASLACSFQLLQPVGQTAQRFGRSGRDRLGLLV